MRRPAFVPARFPNYTRLADLFRRASRGAGSRKPLQETRQLADKGGARQHEIASGVTRRSYEVVLNVRDKTNDGALFCLQVRLEGAQNFQGLA